VNERPTRGREPFVRFNVGLDGSLCVWRRTVLLLEVENVVPVYAIVSERNHDHQVHVRAVARVQNVVEATVRRAIDGRRWRVRQKFKRDDARFGCSKVWLKINHTVGHQVFASLNVNHRVAKGRLELCF